MAKQKGKAQAGWGPWPMILGAILLGLVALMAWSYARAPRFEPPKPPPAATESFPSEGQEHVAPGTKVEYKTDPPTSGPHYGTYARARFYSTVEQLPPAEELVHNLEHGNIVIYYDPNRVPADVLETIKGYTEQWPGTWDGVLAVPRNDPEHPVILTAWTRMLRMKEFNPADAEAFIDAFRGRGPENPVR